MTKMDLAMSLTLYGYMLPYCFTYTKPVRKSIDRYWHRMNKVRRGQVKWRMVGSRFKLEDII